MLRHPALVVTHANTPVSSDDREVLKLATKILRGLNARAWQTCDDRDELAWLVDELVKAGNAVLKANGAPKSKEKAA